MQSQGILECFRQTLKSMSRVYCGGTKRDWEEGLPWLLSAIWEVLQESTGFRLNELVFGCQMRGSIGVVKKIIGRMQNHLRTSWTSCQWFPLQAVESARSPSGRPPQRLFLFLSLLFSFLLPQCITHPRNSMHLYTCTHHWQNWTYFIHSCFFRDHLGHLYTVTHSKYFFCRFFNYGLSVV